MKGRLSTPVAAILSWVMSPPASVEVAGESVPAGAVVSLPSEELPPPHAARTNARATTRTMKRPSRQLPELIPVRPSPGWMGRDYI